MSIAFNIKVKSANGFSSVKRLKDTRLVSELITTAIKNDITTIKGNAIVETVARHNERVLFQSAMFFQRVVTRTPKDEEYKGYPYRYHHDPDDDYVWKHWEVRYWGRKVTAEEMGKEEELFADNLFNDPEIIKKVAEQLRIKLFGGDKFYQRKTRIRNVRFVNEHPRFAMLEYGGYNTNEPPPAAGPKHMHGLQNGYSVQAPYGMLRITQAEMEQMKIGEFDKWLSKFKTHNRGIKRVPSRAAVKKLASVIGDRTHLTTKDIDAVLKIYEVL